MRGWFPDVSGVHVHLRAVRVLRLVRPAPHDHHLQVGPGKAAPAVRNRRGDGRRNDGVLLEKVAVLPVLRVPAAAVREGRPVGIRRGGAARIELQGWERLVRRGERQRVGGEPEPELPVAAHQRTRPRVGVEEEQGPDVAGRRAYAVETGVEGEGTRETRADGDGSRGGDGGGRGV